MVITFQPGDERPTGSILVFICYQRNEDVLHHPKSKVCHAVLESTDFANKTTSSPIPFFNQDFRGGNQMSNLKTLTDKEVALNSSESDNQSLFKSGIDL